MLILSLQGLLQNQSLEKILICTVELEIKRAKRLSQAFVHFVTARASMFTDHKISSQYEPSVDISDQCVNKL